MTSSNPTTTLHQKTVQNKSKRVLVIKPKHCMRKTVKLILDGEEKNHSEILLPKLFLKEENQYPRDIVSNWEGKHRRYGFVRISKRPEKYPIEEITENKKYVKILVAGDVPKKSCQYVQSRFS